MNDDKRSKEIYIEEMNEWVNERKLRISELQTSIKLLEKIKESTDKQAALAVEAANIGIESFNQWALENGCPEIEKL
ncbi:MAG: hypothetical protein WC373_13785 [Smithella sp.]|jgi:hypothetical protein